MKKYSLKCKSIWTSCGLVKDRLSNDKLAKNRLQAKSYSNNFLRKDCKKSLAIIFT